MMLSIFLYAYLSSVYLLWWDVCSDLLPIFKLGCLDFYSVQFSSVQLLSHVRLFATLWCSTHQASLSITHSQSLFKLVSIEWWWHPTISSSVIPFSFCLQSFPASGSFLMSQFFASGGQSIGASTSASVLPMNIQDWFSLGLTGLISLQSNFNTTVQKQGHHKSFRFGDMYC